MALFLTATLGKYPMTLSLTAALGKYPVTLSDSNTFGEIPCMLQPTSDLPQVLPLMWCGLCEERSVPSAVYGWLLCEERSVPSEVYGWLLCEERSVPSAVHGWLLCEERSVPSVVYVGWLLSEQDANRGRGGGSHLPHTGERPLLPWQHTPVHRDQFRGKHLAPINISSEVSIWLPSTSVQALSSHQHLFRCKHSDPVEVTCSTWLHLTSEVYNRGC